jgi:HD-like signal output (HDOD) protein
MSSTPVMDVETESIQHLISQVKGLPALPAIALHLLDAAEDPNTSAADLATLISADPALATRLLRLANSSYYGFPRRIATVNLAVVVLGFETVRDLCLSVLITDCFLQDTGNLPFPMESFWRHSLATAICTRMIYKQIDANHAGDGFIAGLLHDIGKIFLAKYFPDDYSTVISRVENEGALLLETEEAVFATTHSIAGAWLLDEWNLPPWLAESTRLHHSPEEAEPHSKLAAAVCLADILVHKAGITASPGVSIEEAIPIDLASSLRLIREPTGEVNTSYYLEKLQGELKHADDLFNSFQSP